MADLLKKAALMLSAVLMVGAVGGCGGKETASGDVETVSVWTMNSHSEKVVRKLVDEWNDTTGKEKGIFIDYKVQGGDSFTKTINLALQNGTAPDLLAGGGLKDLVEGGHVTPISDMPGGEEFLKKYENSGILREGKGMYKGKIYSVPVNAGAQGLIYNKDMFKAVGIVDENGEAKPPKTWDEMREVARKLTDKSKNQYGMVFPIKWGTGWYGSDLSNPVMSSQGFVDYNPATGKYEYDGMKHAMEVLIGMKHDGSIYPGADSLDNDSARAAFAEGSIGMKFGYTFDVGVLNDQFPAKCDWGVTQYPTYDENVAYKNRMDYGMSYMFNAHSKVTPEKLMEVMKFFTGDHFMLESYKEGVDIPYDPSLVEGVSLENAKHGWAEFAGLVKYGKMQPLSPSQDYAGAESAYETFINKIYSEQISIDEGIAIMNKNANDAVENYYSAHPDEVSEREARIDPNWKPEER